MYYGRLNRNIANLNDTDIFKLFCNADTEGIFQYESSGMKNFLSKLKPDNFSDLYAAVALFRPGPMQNIDTYIGQKISFTGYIYRVPDISENQFILSSLELKSIIRADSFSVSEAIFETVDFCVVTFGLLLIAIMALSSLSVNALISFSSWIFLTMKMLRKSS